jgi:hypothetical protein
VLNCFQQPPTCCVHVLLIFVSAEVCVGVLLQQCPSTDSQLTVS